MMTICIYIYMHLLAMITIDQMENNGGMMVMTIGAIPMLRQERDGDAGHDDEVMLCL